MGGKKGRTFLAQLTVSNLAPVFQTLLAQTEKPSSQAVYREAKEMPKGGYKREFFQRRDVGPEVSRGLTIRSASSGHRMAFSSESCRVQIRAAMRAPADVPVTTLRRRRANGKRSAMLGPPVMQLLERKTDRPRQQTLLEESWN